MTIVKDWKLAYAAGLIDGEGTIGIACYPDRHKYHFTVAVGMMTKEPLEFMRDTFGGTLARNSSHWRWVMYNYEAISVLKQIKPFMQLKAAQVDIGEEFCALLKPRGGSPLGRQGRAPLTVEEIIERQQLSDKMQRLHEV